MAKKRTSKVWIIITVLVVLSGIAGTLIYVKGNDKTTIVQVEKASRRSITQTVTAIGKIQPETEVKISSEASGEVLQLNAKEGDFINKGKLLVRIQPDLVEAQVEQSRAAVKSSGIGIEIAKVELERAQLELNRVMELYKKEFASKQEWETAKANLDRAQGQYNSALNDKGRAEAALRQIQVSASRTTIYSPISGTVTKLDVEQGEKVVGTAQMQGTEMMRISDLSVMNAIVDVDENDVV
ncbi:MAG: efflux RND transporter periplasmic adaptor subunit, partial [Candidatus Kapabacteria bacterium]|nr:efflux RND transporter periplasmic adaptor subunit [Candidatus Kapabacteria bacterium]